VAKQGPQDTPLEVVMVRYYQQHGEALESSETASIALGYWSDFFAGAMVNRIWRHYLSVGLVEGAGLDAVHAVDPE